MTSIIAPTTPWLFEWTETTDNFHLLHYKNMPIETQLQLEEALLRSTEGNWFLINEGSSVAIVMGISGKADELINLALAEQDQIPILRRFSGGGTVIVDEHTLFTTWICEKSRFPFPSFPEPIMRWVAAVYQDALQHPQFALRDNDFVIGERKIGGNAQYIKKDRWLQHTSFLWDYRQERMRYLKHPPKTPAYRAGRSHEEFLSPLVDHFKDKEQLITAFKSAAHPHFLQTGQPS